MFLSYSLGIGFLVNCVLSYTSSSSYTCSTGRLHILKPEYQLWANPVFLCTIWYILSPWALFRNGASLFLWHRTTPLPRPPATLLKLFGEKANNNPTLYQLTSESSAHSLKTLMVTEQVSAMLTSVNSLEAHGSASICVPKGKAWWGGKLFTFVSSFPQKGKPRESVLEDF